MTLFSIFFLLLANQSSQAFYCASIEQIDRGRQECEDNDRVAKAADACVSAYQVKVMAEQAKLQKVLNAQVSGSVKDKQGGNALQNESQDINAEVLASTMKRIDQLILEGQATRMEVAAYIDGLLWPFVWSAEMGEKPKKPDPDLQKLLDEEYCYGEHKEVIQDQIKGLDKMISELQAAKVAAGGLRVKSNANDAKLRASPNGQVLIKGQAPGASTMPKTANPMNRDSDVTGIKEDQQKRK